MSSICSLIIVNTTNLSILTVKFTYTYILPVDTLTIMKSVLISNTFTLCQHYVTSSDNQSKQYKLYRTK